jgi:catechol 2,3-dioxygenase-like lactoylglutathione lyase family enzyme
LHHIAFRVDGENFEAAQRRFRDLGIEFRTADHGIAPSVYVADPDGHRIEITTYDV